MSHEVENMFYTGNVPWHGLGTYINNPPTIEEGIRLAGLDWDVERRQLFMKNGDTEQSVDAFANVRSTDGRVLGVVGKGYRPLQNSQAFSWFQPFVDQGAVSLETAGALRNGKHVWILARINTDPMEIVSGDPVLPYVLLSNSHDGKSSIRAGFTGIRVVCANTVAAAHESHASKLLKVRHTDKASSALEDIQATMNLAKAEFAATAENMRKMASKGVTVETLRKYIHMVFEPKVSLDDEVSAARIDRLCDKVIPLFEHGRGNDMPGVAGTLWGAYNAVTELLTWERGRSADTRLESLWLGPASNIASRAYTEAVKLAA